MNADERRRSRRRHEATREDQRQRYERDRDRILYSSALRRLAGVSQIVRANESDVFHTRLTHTLKVAQLGRRLTQRRLKKQPDECRAVGIDPEVVEAACLAHDLGHPPFGHLGETILDGLASACGGYNGNAQSFRIITKLAVRFERIDGLDLTRATLAATLKYPWMRRENDAVRSSKWGAYATEREDFSFAREGIDGDARTAEAELMDWADDIAYSVHDLEDFHRCRVIPWHVIIEDEYQEGLVANAIEAWEDKPTDAGGRLRSALRRLLKSFEESVPELLREPYEATRNQRRQIRFITSKLIGRYIDAIELTPPATDNGIESCVRIKSHEQDEIRVLKQITRDFVIQNPALAAQQQGHRRVIEQLFKDLAEDIESGRPRFLPMKFRHLAEDEATERAVADCIASLTEAEAIALHGRLLGHASGSVLDPIVR